MKLYRHIAFSLVLTVLSLVLFTASLAQNERGSERRAFFGSETRSGEALLVADWVIRKQDNHGMAFVIVDKKQAKLFVFDVEGRILASSLVLLGAAVGDLTTPGVGDLPLSQIPLKDRTTAAGRFLLRHGLDLKGGKVLWIDFEAALAIHPVAEGGSEMSRLKRMQSSKMEDHRITLGCVVVTKEFYRTALSPLFDSANGYIYILPETMPVAVFFGINT